MHNFLFWSQFIWCAEISYQIRLDRVLQSIQSQISSILFHLIPFHSLLFHFSHHFLQVYLNFRNNWNAAMNAANLFLDRIKLTILIWIAIARKSFNIYLHRQTYVNSAYIPYLIPEASRSIYSFSILSPHSWFWTFPHFSMTCARSFSFLSYP